jgi:hypothetical protein
LRTDVADIRCVASPRGAFRYNNIMGFN